MSWDKEPSKFIEEFGKLYTRRFRRAAFYILREAAVKSPVDTGRFRSNWQVGINSEPRDEVKHITKTAGGVTRREGVVIRRVNPLQGPITVYIVNNLPYAKRLNEGWSDQAPAGWVDAIVRRAKQRLDAGQFDRGRQ